MLSRLFPAAKLLTEGRRAWRWLNGQASLDVVCINLISDAPEHSAAALEAPRESQPHLAGPRLHLAGVAVQTRYLNTSAQDLRSAKGRQTARLQCLAALGWAQARGARVVMLSAATKWLFGRDAAPLKARYPGLSFTTGDNGAALLLCQSVDKAIARAGLRHPRVLVLAPYTALGKALGAHLAARGVDVLGWGPTPGLLAENAPTAGMRTVNDLAKVGPVDLVVACGQGTKPQLGPAELATLCRTDRKLLVLDATPGATVEGEVLARLAGQVLRQDAGLAHAVARRNRQPQRSTGAVFGSLAEAVALFHTLHVEQDPTPLQHDWIDWQPSTAPLLMHAFDRLGLQLIAPQQLDLHWGAARPSRFKLPRLALAA